MMTHAEKSSLFQVSEIELFYHNKTKATDRLKVTTSQNAYDIFISAWDKGKIELLEQCYVLLLDRGNSCLGLINIATGGISGCVVDPKIVYAGILKAKASGFILAHNHPSGSLKPSNADIHLTHKLYECGKFLDLSMTDHQIVTGHGYYSFADEGMLTP